VHEEDTGSQLLVAKARDLLLFGALLVGPREDISFGLVSENLESVLAD